MKIEIGRDYCGWTIHIVADASGEINKETKQPSAYEVRGFAEFRQPATSASRDTSVIRIDVPDHSDAPLQFFDFRQAQDHIFGALEIEIDKRLRPD